MQNDEGGAFLHHAHEEPHRILGAAGERVCQGALRYIERCWRPLGGVRKNLQKVPEELDAQCRVGSWADQKEKEFAGVMCIVVKFPLISFD